MVEGSEPATSRPYVVPAGTTTGCGSGAESGPAPVPLPLPEIAGGPERSDLVATRRTAAELRELMGETIADLEQELERNAALVAGLQRDAEQLRRRSDLLGKVVSLPDEVLDRMLGEVYNHVG